MVLNGSQRLGGRKRRPIEHIAAAIASILIILVVGGQPAWTQSFELEAATNSTVRILVAKPPGRDGKKRGGSGSGFIVSEQGYIVTNFHVVQGGRGFMVYSAREDSSKPVEKWPARLVDKSPERDYALLKIEADLSGRAVRLNVALPPKGAKVMALGFPGASDVLSGRISLDPSLTEGKVSKTESSLIGGGLRSQIQHTANIAKGNSGGPLFDVCGDVIGVNTLGAKGAAFYAAVHVAEFADKLKRSDFGVSVVEAACTGEGASRDRASSGIPVYAYVIVAVLVLAAAAFVLLRPKLAAGGLSVLGGFGGAKTGGGSGTGGTPSSGGASPGSESITSLNPANGEGLQTALCTLTTVDAEGEKFEVDLEPADLADPVDGCVLGRSFQLAHLEIDDSSVSRRHARIRRVGDSLLVEDLNSSNGTQVNGQRLAPFAPQELADGDRVQIGSVTLRVTMAS